MSKGNKKNKWAQFFTILGIIIAVVATLFLLFGDGKYEVMSLSFTNTQLVIGLFIMAAVCLYLGYLIDPDTFKATVRDVGRAVGAAVGGVTTGVLTGLWDSVKDSPMLWVGLALVAGWLILRNGGSDDDRQARVAAPDEQTRRTEEGGPYVMAEEAP